MKEVLGGACRGLYSRTMPGVEIEILSWVASVSAPSEGHLGAPAAERPSEPKPRSRRPLFDAETGEFREVDIYWRGGVSPRGPPGAPPPRATKPNADRRTG